MARLTPDTKDRIEDDWASELMLYTRPEDVPEIADAYPWGTWEGTTREVRNVFRARARRMRAGDLSVLPFTTLPGEEKVPRG